MPRYVILEHDWPHRHWDLMLECDGVLKTWRLDEPPTPDHSVRAEAIGDHRMAYLDYEGAVSGGRGTVKRLDAGEYVWMDSDLGKPTIEIFGTLIRGRLELRNNSGIGSCVWVPVGCSN